ncbi:hypothetical protein BC827DRAFT_1264751 [Russula dissimulans]|nr:hypothetical protein BC827DRAFT_1264751 [Russula dissimulans]
MADIQDYFFRRTALVQEDMSLRRENKLLRSLTEKEAAADKIVRRIRAEEAVSIWGVEHDDIPHLFPGMEFLTSIAENSTATPHEFRPFKEAQSPRHASVTDAEYPGYSWLPLHQARASFALGGPEGFDQWVVGGMSINPAEAYGKHNTVPKVRGRALFPHYAVLTNASDMAKVYRYLH